MIGQIQGGGPVASDFPGGDLGKGPCGRECIAAATILGDSGVWELWERDAYKDSRGS